MNMFLWSKEDFKEANLKPNYVYRIQVEIDGETKEWKFYTKLSPFYSTRRKVRGEMMHALEGVPNAHIDLMIHENSKYVEEIAKEEILSQLAKGVVPAVVERYVRYKTQLDIITDLLIALSTQSGMSEKSLGDFKIMYELSAPDIKPLLDILEPRVEKLEKALTESSADISASVVRGGSTAYPLSRTL